MTNGNQLQIIGENLSKHKLAFNKSQCDGGSSW